ncbi:hypothetical protein DHW03_16040 [Pedobacter yonginense]|uniref:Uncharacterized protein n=1 Tax=Pedobacter yonginense TaxID=651869 RepID=A0A317EJJ0_9SPHI|nr:hypothetical protein DHW03_16040 [Pedobacter yonginense]
MFIAFVIVPIYILGFIAMFYMQSFYKALMLLLTMLIATFILFLFITYPFQSAMVICCLIALFNLRIKIN